MHDVRVTLLTASDVIVHVEDDRGPLPGAFLWIYRCGATSYDGRGRVVAGVEADAAGSAKLPLLANALEYAVEVHGPHGRTRSDGSLYGPYAPFFAPRWRPTPTTWRLRPGLPLRIRVEDEHGDRRAGLRLRVWAGGEELLAGGLEGKHILDENGRLNFDLAPTGPSRLRIEVPVHEEEVETIEVDVAESERGDVRIVAPAGEACEVRVRATGAASEPLPSSRSVWVATRLGNGETPGGGVLRVVGLDPDGNGDGSRRWRVTSRHWPKDARFLACFPNVGYVDVPIRAGQRVDAPLHAGEALTLRFDAGVFEEDEQINLLLSRSVLGPETGVRATVRDDVAVVRGLAPGAWRVRVPPVALGGTRDAPTDQLWGAHTNVVVANTGVVTTVERYPSAADAAAGR